MNKSNLSPKVKELLSRIDWNYKQGTVNSLDLLDQISLDKTLNILITMHNLSNIKHQEILLDDLLKNALSEAKDLNSSLVETTHLLISILKTLKSKKYKKVKNQIKELLRVKENLTEETATTKAFSSVKPGSDFPFYDEKPKVVTFESLGVVKDLTKLAKQNKLKKVISRRNLEDRIISTITKKYKNSLLLMGTKGSGKTSLIISLANRISTGDVPSHLKKVSLISINLPALINSLEMRDKFELSFKDFVEKMSRENTFTIFFFDDMHLMSSSGLLGFSPPIVEQFLDFSNKDNINNIHPVPNIAFISAINDDQNDRFLDGPVYDLWENLEVGEPTNRELKKILKYKIAELEDHFNVNLAAQSLNYIIENKDYLNTNESPSIEFFVNLIDDIFATFTTKYSDGLTYNDFETYKAIVTEKNPSWQNTRKIDSALLHNEIQDYIKINIEGAKLTKTYIPISFVRQHLAINYRLKQNIFNQSQDYNKLKYLSDQIKKDIVGQNEAVDSLVSTIKRSLLKLSGSSRPLASLLFLGPTGVGKTETAKSLSRHLYGKNSLIRIDMSDFMEKHTIARLVGSPPGYVGYGESGQLTGFVQNNPNCVVLFDEIEKAHPDVLNILLQILEEGELSTGSGEVIPFKKSVVILTSNMGADIIKRKPIGFINKGFDIKNQDIKNNLLTNLKKEIKPEILNRLNDIVVFNMLKKSDAHQIMLNNLDVFYTNLKKGYNIKLQIQKNVLTHLLKLGYSEEYGAREVKRSIEKNLIDLVVDYIITNPKVKNLKAVLRANKIKIEKYVS